MGICERFYMPYMTLSKKRYSNRAVEKKGVYTEGKWGTVPSLHQKGCLNESRNVRDDHTTDVSKLFNETRLEIVQLKRWKSMRYNILYLNVIKREMRQIRRGASSRGAPNGATPPRAHAPHVLR